LFGKIPSVAYYNRLFHLCIYLYNKLDTYLYKNTNIKIEFKKTNSLYKNVYLVPKFQTWFDINFEKENDIYTFYFFFVRKRKITFLTASNADHTLLLTCPAEKQGPLYSIPPRCQNLYFPSTSFLQKKK